MRRLSSAQGLDGPPRFPSSVLRIGLHEDSIPSFPHTHSGRWRCMFKGLRACGISDAGWLHRRPTGYFQTKRRR